MYSPALLAGLSPVQKRALAVAVLAGGLLGTGQLRKLVRDAQREQRRLCAGLFDEGKPGKSRRPRVAVDGLFLKRLLKILRICVPGLASPEMGLILVQGCLLVSRTWFTDVISRIEARSGRFLIAQEYERFFRVIGTFVAVAVPAAVVNSGLKFMQKQIQLAFMRRLSHHLHERYCANRAYYAASVLGGLQNADQRITEDVEKFAHSISELYSYTFKPLLDVLLFTRSLAAIMGYRPQLLLYGYYVASAFALRALAPPLAAMTAQETGLAGSLRHAHQRLVTNAEEVAFNDPPSGAAEQLILNQHLFRLLRHGRLSALQRGLQQVFDGFFIKYMASVVAMLSYAVPLYFGRRRQGSRDDAAQDYIRATRLLQATSRGVGDLVLVYKRISGLAGHTSRVSELLEAVARLSGGDGAKTRRELYLRNVSSGCLAGAPAEALPPPRRSEGPAIRFHRVALNAPDGTRLVRELSFEVPPGRSVMVMGPNGSGKSSLFRVLAGLWPLQGGEITVGGPGSMFYLSQRPYLVAGSLRDQLLYPQPPAEAWAAASPARRKAFKHLRGVASPPDEVDARLEWALEAVELDYLLARGRGWEQKQNWNDTLSGGEKQRLAMARLLFHGPTYAILDECTSAVSADGEQVLYRALREAGVTMLSIAHRPALRQFHDFVVHFEGSQEGNGWHLEELSPAAKAAPAPEA